MYDCNYRNISLNPKPEFSTAQSFYPSQGPLNCRDSSLCLITVPSGSGLNVIFSGKHLLMLRVTSDQICTPVISSPNTLMLIMVTITL